MKRIARGGFTLVEIMIVVAIIALLAAIAVPNVLRGRTSANEAAAIGNLRALNSSVQMFQSVNATFPTSAGWVAMMYPGGGVPSYGPNSFNAAGVGGAGFTVQGFTYVYTSLPAGCAATQASPCSDYSITAAPQSANRTGTRAFFTDSSAEIRHEPVASAPATMACPTIDQPLGGAC